MLVSVSSAEQEATRHLGTVWDTALAFQMLLLVPGYWLIDLGKYLSAGSKAPVDPATVLSP